MALSRRDRYKYLYIPAAIAIVGSFAITCLIFLSFPLLCGGLEPSMFLIIAASVAVISILLIGLVAVALDIEDRQKLYNKERK